MSVTSFFGSVNPSDPQPPLPWTLAAITAEMEEVEAAEQFQFVSEF
jgi:hypothetical protein